jgi:hypothetical protein
MYRVLSEEVAKKKQKRRKKRKAEKQAAKRNKAARGSGADAVPLAEAAADGHSSEEEAEAREEGGGAAQGDALAAADEFAAAHVIVNKHKVRSFAFAPPAAARPGGALGQVAISLANNSIEVCVGGGWVGGWGWGGMCAQTRMCVWRGGGKWLGVEIGNSREGPGRSAGRSTHIHATWALHLRMHHTIAGSIRSWSDQCTPLFNMSM